MSSGNDFLPGEVEVGRGQTNVLDVELQLLRRGVDLRETTSQRAKRGFRAQRLQVRAAVTAMENKMRGKWDFLRVRAYVCACVRACVRARVCVSVRGNLLWCVSASVGIQ